MNQVMQELQQMLMDNCMDAEMVAKSYASFIRSKTTALQDQIQSLTVGAQCFQELPDTLMDQRLFDGIDYFKEGQTYIPPYPSADTGLSLQFNRSDVFEDQGGQDIIISTPYCINVNANALTYVQRTEEKYFIWATEFTMNFSKPGDITTMKLHLPFRLREGTKFAIWGFGAIPEYHSEVQQICLVDEANNTYFSALKTLWQYCDTYISCANEVVPYRNALKAIISDIIVETDGDLDVSNTLAYTASGRALKAEDVLAYSNDVLQLNEVIASAFDTLGSNGTIADFRARVQNAIVDVSDTARSSMNRIADSVVYGVQPITQKIKSLVDGIANNAAKLTDINDDATSLAIIVDDDQYNGISPASAWVSDPEASILVKTGSIVCKAVSTVVKATVGVLKSILTPIFSWIGNKVKEAFTGTIIEKTNNSKAEFLGYPIYQGKISTTALQQISGYLYNSEASAYSDAIRRALASNGNIIIKFDFGALQITVLDDTEDYFLYQAFVKPSEYHIYRYDANQNSDFPPYRDDRLTDQTDDGFQLSDQQAAEVRALESPIPICYNKYVDAHTSSTETRPNLLTMPIGFRWDLTAVDAIKGIFLVENADSLDVKDNKQMFNALVASCYKLHLAISIMCPTAAFERFVTGPWISFCNASYARGPLDVKYNIIKNHQATNGFYFAHAGLLPFQADSQKIEGYGDGIMFFSALNFLSTPSYCKANCLKGEGVTNRTLCQVLNASALNIEYFNRPQPYWVEFSNESWMNVFDLMRTHIYILGNKTDMMISHLRDGQNLDDRYFIPYSEDGVITEFAYSVTTDLQNAKKFDHFLTGVIATVTVVAAVVGGAVVGIKLKKSLFNKNVSASAANWQAQDMITQNQYALANGQPLPFSQDRIDKQVKLAYKAQKRANRLSKLCSIFAPNAVAAASTAGGNSGLLPSVVNSGSNLISAAMTSDIGDVMVKQDTLSNDVDTLSTKMTKSIALVAADAGTSVLNTALTIKLMKSLQKQLIMSADNDNTNGNW